MTVSTDTNRWEYDGNDATTVFPYTGKIFAQADLVVHLIDAEGAATLQVLGTDYTVSGVGATAGGNVTFTTAPATGETVLIRRVLSIVQSTSVKNQGAFYPEIHEDAFDRFVMIDQQQQDQINRTFRTDPTDVTDGDIGFLPAKADRAGKFLLFDDDGNPTTTELNSDEILNSAANAAASAAEAATSATNAGTSEANADAHADRADEAAEAAQNALNAATPTIDRFSGDGVDTAFTLSRSVSNENYTQVFIDGVYQQKDTYSISGTTLTFTAAPPAGTDNIEVIIAAQSAMVSGDTSDLNYSQGGTGSVTRGLAAKLREIVSVKDFGAVGDGVTDDTAAIQAAIVYANANRNEYVLDTIAAHQKLAIYFPPGEYLLGSTVVLDTELIGIEFVCPFGRANIVSDGTKSYHAFTANRAYLFECIGLNFVGFDTVFEFDTNNVDTAKIVFKNCDTIDNNTFLDTRSYPESRSTVLTFDGCRSSGTPRLANAYVDKFNIINCSFRNGSDSGAFIVTDANVTVINSGFVPYFVGATSRWFDFYASDQSRGFQSYGTRFGAESGGHPIIYNYGQGNDFSVDKKTLGILFSGGEIASTNAFTPDACVVLMDNGAGGSYAPNMISFVGVHWNSTNGLVVTESGNLPTLDRKKFVIDIDRATQTPAAETVVQQLVSDELRPYLARNFLAPGEVNSGAQDITATGSISVDVGTAGIVIFSTGGATTVTALTGALSGERATLIVRTGTITIQDASTAAGNIHLQGGADAVLDANDTLELIYDRAANRWYEMNRSAN